MTTPNDDPEQTERVVSSDPRFTPHYTAHDAQFAPGSIIAGRYRVASILGKGGMGEVYRADDTRLGQTVALKFLPARLARDPMLLARLHDEVRLGRQIAHPNVCRIYDIADWEGAHFVAMEFVDGEDLARLLKRIGRLAHDKAVDIARGVAAGLMAAHAKGILHRDLKPANVMIDSHGEARITDFGLALSADDEADGQIAGTPAYMAPELLEGQPSTIQTDLYALGLVMYELFTGHRAYNARTFPERAREVSSQVTNPSAHIRDLDPAVERIILRCLSNDPLQRPRSAREVIEALPGGDPLAAAMAAGETPSPRIIAAAGTVGALKPAVAWSLLALVIALLIAATAMRRVAGAPLRGTMQKRPEVLAERATTLLRELGIPGGPHTTYRFETNKAYIAWIYTQDQSRTRWQRLRRGIPAAMFWFRQSSAPARVGAARATPPEGMTEARLDMQGRLFELHAVPQRSWTARKLDWRPLLAAAGLDLSKLTPATPEAIPAGADVQAAWTGRHPEDGTPIRVEAAAWRGVPVLFRVSGPWDDPSLIGKMPFSSSILFISVSLLMTVMIVLGALLAWRNLRLRRGDRRAAFRLAIAIIVLEAIAGLAMADHQLDVPHELTIVTDVLGAALLWGAIAWVLYIALEPFMRRRWPDKLISWARLMGGNLRDPMIGRDLMIGIAAGFLHSVIASGDTVFGENMDFPYNGELLPLTGFRHAIGAIAGSLSSGTTQGFVLMMVLVVMTMLLRKRAFGVAGFTAILYSAYALASHSIILPLSMALLVAMVVVVIARFGLLAMAAAQTSFHLSFTYPTPTDASWHAAIGVITLLLLGALAVWAFRTSLGDQSPWSAALLDD